MERIFYNKKISILFVAAMLVLVILACMLLVNLTQWASVRHRIEAFEVMLEQAQNDVETRQKMLEYLQTDDYVREWAEKNGKLSEDDILWLESNK